LDIDKIAEEAHSRWLRPNEIFAILCNHGHFNISAKPLDTPASGTIILFDRKALRNFRKDGHAWRKKKDGKTVKEAHEHLKVGNEERIHVYYAHGEDNPKFVRRSYWLLDRAYEHIVLVHYREVSEVSTKGIVSPQGGLRVQVQGTRQNLYHGYHQKSLILRRMLLDIHTKYNLQALILSDGYGEIRHGPVYWEKHFQNDTQVGSTPFEELGQSEVWRSEFNEQNQLALPEQDKMILNQWVEAPNLQSPSFESVDHSKVVVEPAMVCDSIKTRKTNSLKNQDSFGRWLSSVLEDSPSLEDEWPKGGYRQGEEMDSHATGDQSLVQGEVFSITEVSPTWAFSTEETKVIITGYFAEAQKNILEAKWSCVFGEIVVPAEEVQIGVFRCRAPQHAPGMVNLFLTCNEQLPHSQVLSFEYRVNAAIHLDKINCFAQTEVIEDFSLQIRLFHLLFSSFKGFLSLSDKNTGRLMNLEKLITSLFANNEGDWLSLPKLVTRNRKSLAEAKSHLLELILKKKLREWVLEKAVEKGGATVRDSLGQGVIHLLAALGYDWAVIPISTVGMSMNFRDRHGWTALHWAAFYG
ncbi:hypothetical protein KI387_011083, partial [Taxus chinensis]